MFYLYSLKKDIVYIPVYSDVDGQYLHTKEGLGTFEDELLGRYETKELALAAVSRKGLVYGGRDFNCNITTELVD